MNNRRERFTTNWHPMRILRLGAGIALLVAAINSQDYLVGALSILLLYQGIFNVGCCGAACRYSPRSHDSSQTTNPEFEEIKK